MRIGKRLLALLCAAVLLLSLCPVAFAAETPYTLTEADCTVEENGDGGLTILRVTGVTATNIVIPEKLTPDGKDVTALGGGERVFGDYPPDITGITLPDTVTELGDNAFSGLKYLTGIDFPASLRTIGEGAFDFCNRLTDIVWNDGLVSIGDCAFRHTNLNGTLELPDSVLQLGRETFSNTKISDIGSLGGVTELPPYVFNHCDLLSQVDLPDTITGMGEGIFSECMGLERVTLPDGLTEIPSYAFRFSWNNSDRPSSSLAEVNLPATVTSIGSSAFKGNTRLAEITLPVGLTTLGSFAFDGCSGLTAIAIPDGVTEIARETFIGCRSLRTIKLPANLTTVRPWAFQYCNVLESVIFPPSLTTLEGPGVFSYATSLSDITFLGTAPSTGGSNPFPSQNQSPNLVVYYPDGDPSYDVLEANCSGVTFAPISAKPDAPEAGDTAITLSAVLEHSNQDTLLLWCTVDVTPKTHPDNSAYYPSGSISLTVDGKKLPPPTHFVGGGTSTHVTFGYRMEEYAGEGKPDITIQAHISDSIGFTGSSSNTLTGKVVMPPNKGNQLPFLPSETPGEAVYETAADDAGTGIIITKINGEMASRPEPVIPAEIGGKTVTGLGDGLFAGNQFTAYVTLPSSIKTLGNGVFRDCPYLISVYLPAGIATIPTGTFSGCGRLISANIPNGVTSIGADTFRGCTALGAMTFPASLNTLDSTAFSGCALTSVLFNGNAPAFNGDPKTAFGPETILYTAQEVTGYDLSPWRAMRREPVELGLDFDAEFVEATTSMLVTVKFDTGNYHGFDELTDLPDLSKVTVRINNFPQSKGVTIKNGKISVPITNEFLGQDAFVNISYPGDWYFKSKISQSKTGILPYEKFDAEIVDVAADTILGQDKSIALKLTPKFVLTLPSNQAYQPDLAKMALTLNSALVENFTVEENKTLCADVTALAGQSIPVTLMFQGDYHFNPSNTYSTTVTIPASPTDPPPAPVTKLSATVGAVYKADGICFLPLDVDLSFENPGSGIVDRAKLSVTLNGEAATRKMGEENILNVTIPTELLGSEVKVAVSYAGQSEYNYPAKSVDLGTHFLADPSPAKADTALTVTAGSVVWYLGTPVETTSTYGLPLTPKLTHTPYTGDRSLTPNRADVTVTMNGVPVSANAFRWIGDTLYVDIPSDKLNTTATFVLDYPGDEHFNPADQTLNNVSLAYGTPTPPSGDGGGGGGSSAVTKPSTDENAKVTVSSKDATEAVKAAADSGSVVLKAEAREDAKSVAVTVPASVMKAIAKAEAPVAIQSPVADLMLDTKVLETLQANGAKDVVVSAGAADTAALPKAAQTVLEGRPIYDISITAGGKSVSQFNGGSVTVALPYTLAADESADRLTACWVKDDGTTEVLRNSVYKNGKLTFSTPHLSTYAILHAEVDFLDVSEDSWAKSDIDFVIARGVLKGMGDDGAGGQLFGPSVTLTGTMAVVALARMDGVADGTGDDWAAPALSWAREQNILPEGFIADKAVTREQFAYMVAGYLGGAKPVSLPAYLDIKQSMSSCVDSIYYLSSLDVMNGTGDGCFSPKLSLTRSELAAVLHRLVVLQLG